MTAVKPKRKSKTASPQTTLTVVNPTPKRRLSEHPRVRISSQSGQRAFLDAASTSRINEKHWANATAGNIDFLMREDLGILRRRARYEIMNNGYGSGIADTLAFDIVGHGPRPQMNSGNEAFDQESEEKFMRWSERCDFNQQMSLAELLQMQAGLQQCEAGESLTLIKSDPNVAYDVSLRLLAVEIERLESPIMAASPSKKLHDGIGFDDFGRPQKYYVMKNHPDGEFSTGLADFDVIPASQAIHLYRVKRPGQSRGIPWFASSLDLFAQLRRFTLATLDAAETAADIAGTLEAEGLDPDPDIQSNDVIELERKALLVTPAGYAMKQIKAEHPTTTYKMFKAEIINEIARGVLMPYNVAAANSAEYNYASGRLDHQKYHRFIETIRFWIQRQFLSRIFSEWMTQAYLLGDYFTSKPTFEQAMLAVQSVAWFWPGFEHVDPVKEANAEQIRLNSGTLTLATSYAKQGKDWRRELEQRGKEIALMKQLGITPATQSNPIEDDEDDNDGTEPKTKNKE